MLNYQRVHPLCVCSHFRPVPINHHQPLSAGSSVAGVPSNSSRKLPVEILSLAASRVKNPPVSQGFYGILICLGGEDSTWNLRQRMVNPRDRRCLFTWTMRMVIFGGDQIQLVTHGPKSSFKDFQFASCPLGPGLSRPKKLEAPPLSFSHLG